MRPALVVAILLSLASAASSKGAPARWQTLPEPPAMPAASTTGDVPVDDVAIHYAVYGDGAPVVLLHGGMGNGDHWAIQVAALAPAHRVIVIDSRGQGRSTRSKRGVTYHAMAEDTIAVLDALKIDRAAVVGWSDGAITGLDLAIHHGDRLTKLFAFAANFDVAGMRKGGAGARTVADYFKRCKAQYAQIAPHPDQVNAAVRDLGRMWTHEPAFTREQLGGIRVVTAIVDGDHDELIRREHTELMAKLIPGATLIILKDASHFALWQAPDDFDRALLDFLDAPAK